MLVSSCPGFVCLAEKTAPDAVPLLSSAKSPMAAAGALLKSGQCDDLPAASARSAGEGGPMGDAASRYHVAIMPCHDKKLEAGRSDFKWERRALPRYGNASPKSADTINSATFKARPLLGVVNDGMGAVYYMYNNV